MMYHSTDNNGRMDHLTRNDYIDRFQVINQLPKTGLGTVYRVEDPTQGEVVVVKTLPENVSAGFDWYQRYLGRLSALDHPLVVPIYEVRVWLGQFLIVMQEMTGGSLAQRLADGPLQPRLASRVIARLAEGLEGLHQRGITHHNITPNNILFNQHGDPCLSDFGLTRLLEGNPYASRHWILGNPAYQSPEFLLGSSAAGPAADRYSLGAVYYHLLSRTPPYQAKTPVSTAVQHLRIPLPKVCKRTRAIPEPCREVITTATQTRPERRYGSGQEMAAAVRKHIPTETGGRKAARRWVTLPISILLVVIAGITGLFLSQPTGPTTYAAASQTALALAPPATTAPQTPSTTPVPDTPTPTATPTLPPRPPGHITNILNTPTVSATPTATIPVQGGADKIAFLYKNDIWWMNIDGTDEKRLTVDEEPKSDLFWTDDGRVITYKQDNRWYEVNTQTGIISNATVKDPYDQKYCNLPTDGKRRMIQYSKDGKKAAAVVETNIDGKFTEVIEVYDISDSCTNPVPLDQFPAKRFTIPRFMGYLSEYAWNGTDLFVMTIDVIHELGDMVVYNHFDKTHIIQQPVPGECCYRDFQWSPDGNYLMFVFQESSTGQNTDLYYVPYGMMGSGGQYQPIPLPDYLDFDPAQRLYPILRPASTPTPKISSPLLVIPNEEEAVIGGIDKIAFIARQDIWIMNPNGSGRQKITTNGHMKSDLQWSPDGNSIFYKTGIGYNRVDIHTKEIFKLGDFQAIQFSQENNGVVVSENTVYEDQLVRQRGLILPYNPAAFLRLKTLDQLNTLGGCPWEEADHYRWSAETQTAVLVREATFQGRYVDMITLFDFDDCLDPFNLVASFPDTHFELRGYSEEDSQDLIEDFAWNGHDLFAINGDVEDNFGDMLIFNVALGTTEVLDPLNKSWGYRDFRWSPDGSYFFFTTRYIDQIELYYMPYDDVVNAVQHEPIPLPLDFFDYRNLDQRLYPALRPAERPTSFYDGRVTRTITESPLVVRGAGEIQTQDQAVFSIAFSPNDDWMAVGTEATLHLWQLNPKKWLKTLEIGDQRHHGPVTAVDLFRTESGDETWLASASADHTFRIWRTSYFISYYLHENGLPIQDMVFHPDGDKVAIASAGNRLEIRGIKTGAIRGTFSGHTGPVLSVAFTAGGELLASGSADKTARIWDVASGEQLLELNGHLDSVSAVAFSPDGGTLATASWDGMVKLWRVSDGELLHTLTGHTAPLTSLAFSPNGEVLASGADDNTVLIWDADEPALLWRSGDLDAPILDLAFNHGGDTLAASLARGTVQFWDLGYGE